MTARPTRTGDDGRQARWRRTHGVIPEGPGRTRPRVCWVLPLDGQVIPEIPATMRVCGHLVGAYGVSGQAPQQLDKRARPRGLRTSPSGARHERSRASHQNAHASKVHSISTQAVRKLRPYRIHSEPTPLPGKATAAAARAASAHEHETLGGPTKLSSARIAATQPAALKAFSAFGCQACCLSASENFSPWRNATCHPSPPRGTRPTNGSQVLAPVPGNRFS